MKTKYVLWHCRLRQDRWQSWECSHSHGEYSLSSSRQGNWHLLWLCGCWVQPASSRLHEYTILSKEKDMVLYASSKFERQNADELKPDLCENDQHIGIQVQKIHVSQSTLEDRAHLSRVRKFRVLSPGVMDLHRILNTEVLYYKKVNAMI